MPTLKAVSFVTHSCCRRCLNYHDQHFSPFTERPEAPEGDVFSHFATCPNTGEPILYRSRRVATVLSDFN